MALAITTITHSISNLGVSGVTIHDIHNIPENLSGRDCPTMFPRPDGFISGVRLERDSMGIASTARKTFRYTLHYVYCHSPIGDGRGLFDIYAGMVEKVGLILDELIANDDISGAVDMNVMDISTFGPVNDPAGNTFHGCELALDIMEFIN